MIEKFLVSELGTITELNGQFYPVAAPVGELDGSFCIYTRISGEIQRDLTGEPVFYLDVYRLDLCEEDTDLLLMLQFSEQSQIDGKQCQTNQRTSNTHV